MHLIHLEKSVFYNIRFDISICLTTLSVNITYIYYTISLFSSHTLLTRPKKLKRVFHGC